MNVVSLPRVPDEADEFIRLHTKDYGAVPDEERIRLQRKDVEDSIVLAPEANDRLIVHNGHQVGVRIIRPTRRARGVALDVHGGGWFTGRAAMNDQSNAALAHALGIAVVSVDYRLAPEWPFPAAVEDCTAAARWLLANATIEFGTDRTVMIGESAGAQPALLALLALRDEPEPSGSFRGAAFSYGMFDLGHTPSQRGAGAGPDVLSPQGIEFFTRLYVGAMGDENRRHERVSPLYADLTGLPPALLMAGTADHLVDDSAFLAARWQRGDPGTQLVLYQDAPHGADHLPSIGPDWVARRNDFLASRLALATH
ncbi:alpha/beta hydrolase fold domain-containing protein [Nonomuraea sp. M3C6]|uniref:Alpha/beta hydrolase fold domain-containing protein n=1 Tax=Nonomuraea marmarensis TaxID=3351344 RepID=A0ABW7AIT1_9ACTN